MEYIKKTPLNQLSFFPTTLDGLIDTDNAVRFILQSQKLKRKYKRV